MDAFGAGLFVGAAIILAAQFALEDTPSLTDCAKRHNVYACKLVAVPITDAIRTPPTGEEQ